MGGRVSLNGPALRCNNRLHPVPLLLVFPPSPRIAAFTAWFNTAAEITDSLGSDLSWSSLLLGQSRFLARQFLSVKRLDNIWSGFLPNLNLVSWIIGDDISGSSHLRKLTTWSWTDEKFAIGKVSLEQLCRSRRNHGTQGENGSCHCPGCSDSGCKEDGSVRGSGDRFKEGRL